MGAQYTLADIVVTPSIDRMADLGFASIWNEKYPRVDRLVRAHAGAAGVPAGVLQGHADVGDLSAAPAIVE